MKRWLGLGLVLGLAMAGGHAPAQQPNLYKPAPAVPERSDPLMPRQPGSTKLPWERDVEKFLNPPVVDPTRPAVKKLYDDPMAKLGLPPNVSPSRLLPQRPAAAPAPPDFSRRDPNGDGTISRGEYMKERRRTPPVLGETPSLREQTLNSRANTRFRRTDRNGDGMVTPDEYNAAPNSRF